LLAKHGDECGKQGDHETRVHEAGDGDDLPRWIFLNERNYGGLTGDGRLIEGEEDGPEEGCGLFIRIGLEVRMDVDDESGVDGREQTGLYEQIR